MRGAAWLAAIAILAQAVMVAPLALGMARAAASPATFGVLCSSAAGQRDEAPPPGDRAGHCLACQGLPTPLLGAPPEPLAAPLPRLVEIVAPALAPVLRALPAPPYASRAPPYLPAVIHAA